MTETVLTWSILETGWRQAPTLRHSDEKFILFYFAPLPSLKMLRIYHICITIWLPYFRLNRNVYNIEITIALYISINWTQVYLKFIEEIKPRCGEDPAKYILVLDISYDKKINASISGKVNGFY